MNEPNGDLIEAVTNELWKLDGSTLLAVALITGFDIDTIRDLGGVDEEFCRCYLLRERA